MAVNDAVAIWAATLTLCTYANIQRNSINKFLF